MKFLTKINRNYFIILAISLVVVSILGYIVFDYSIWQDAKESLQGKATLLTGYINKTHDTLSLEPILKIQKISKMPSQLGFKQVNMAESKDEEELYLEYSTVNQVDGDLYLITVRNPMEETEDLIIALVFFFISIIGIIFLAAYFFSKKMNKTVWSVFENNLQQIEQFNLNADKSLTLNTTHIEEFDRLNWVIQQFSQRIRQDYNNLKEFTENASHEMQTPVAIALLNLEEILQHELPEEVYKKTNSTIQALKRLSQLNQSLILLSKIENNQFKNTSKINFNELIQKKNEELLPLLSARNLKLLLRTVEEFYMDMNPELAEILINNLFSNAIKHNVKNGFIEIHITQNSMTFCNSGEGNALNPKTIFERFSKGNSDSFGLGLAIVKKICEMYYMEIRYEKNDYHCFVIEKTNKS